MKKIEDGFDNVDQDSDQMEQRGRQGSTSACPNQSESLALDLREEAPPASSSVWVRLSQTFGPWLSGRESDRRPAHDSWISTGTADDQEALITS